MASTPLTKTRAPATRKRLTSRFFLFGILLCLAQGIVQSLLFTIDSEYNTLLFDITQAAAIPAPNHTNLIFANGGYLLELCNNIPHSPEVCTYIFDSAEDIVATDNLTIGMDAILRGEIITNSFNQGGFKIQPDPTSQQVIFEGQGLNTVSLSSTCTSILLYPAEHLENSRRENLVLVLLQFWLFGISVLAMMYDSVPHVLTVFITRILLTAWSIYALWRTNWQSTVFNEMIETSGTPCSIAIFGQYFSTRVLYERLVYLHNFSWISLRTFDTGASITAGMPTAIMRVYKYFLALQVCLQLGVFVLFTFTGLWADQLFSTYIHAITSHFKLYEAIVLCFAIAWFGLRYEKPKIIIAFIAMALMFLMVDVLMFISPVYRWTFYAWPFLACFVTASLILFAVVSVLGIVCMKNFGKGLSKYIGAQSSY